MARGTKKQLRCAKLWKNPRIGQCAMPHCKTLYPAKNQFLGMCHFHMRLLKYWVKKTGYKPPVIDWLSSSFWTSVDEMRAEYCEWIRCKVALWDYFT